jgi:predicted O-methyltransferase YrrM
LGLKDDLANVAGERLTVKSAFGSVGSLARGLPVIGPVLRKYFNRFNRIEQPAASPGWPVGHYYSTIPAAEDVDLVHANMAQTDSCQLSGIDLNLHGQKELISQLQVYYADQPFAESAEKAINRYFYDNHWFVYADGYFLHAMMRHFRPQSIVEVGSGFSSAMMLDTADLFFEGGTRITFIEPYPDERLTQLLASRTSSVSYQLFRNRLQDVTERPWADLVENDFLFIDSSHVSKCGSDVNRLFFEILPQLAPGVIVHVHDIFSFFEYPKTWTDSGWYWNESYLLRAFLTCNSEFEILLWPNVVLPRNPELEHLMPLCFKNTGSSFWMRRRKK